MESSHSIRSQNSENPQKLPSEKPKKKNGQSLEYKYKLRYESFTRTKYHYMNNVTKISLSIGGLATFGLIAYYIQIPTDPTIDSLRTQAQEARNREIQAKEDRETREDTLSQALYDQCYSESIALTGARFEEKQRKAHECWKSQTIKTNT
jgi:hypothetical protein